MERMLSIKALSIYTTLDTKAQIAAAALQAAQDLDKSADGGGQLTIRRMWTAKKR